MTIESKQERTIRIFAESVADQKAQMEAGVPGAHLRWALAECFLEALLEGHQITDLDCFRLDSRYTGNQPKAELPATIKTSLQRQGIISPDPETLIQQLAEQDLENITSGTGKISCVPTKNRSD